ncbi:response regulator [Paenibacillus glycinis]|uniref:Response regulator n=1 Tax=Paenibacillus glycinis TaxID=2697035 RepID=A0ABW9XPX0_9BACL|nr:response regulator [Paenibacillus glycinis]NBD24697.1 response regulator [Paenibacillus glycinis]
MNIYLVEDERWALAELVELFKRYQPAHRVLAFGSGEDALQAAATDPPQLVLTDINMPGMDGLELIEELIARHPDVKGIVLSVHDQFAYAQRGMKLGVIDYLLKPVKKDVLYKAIDKAMQGIADDGRSKDDRTNWSLMQQLIAAESPEAGTAAPLAHRRCGLALLQIDNKPGSAGSGDDACAGRRAAALKSHFRHPGLQGQALHCLTIDAKRKVFLAPAPDDGLAEAFRSGLSAMHASLLREGMQAHVAYAFKAERESLNHSYEGLLRRFEAQVLFGQPTWIEPAARSEKIRQTDLAAVWEKVRVLQTHLKQGDVRKGRETIRKIGDELRMKAVTMKQLTLFVNDLFYSLKYNLEASARGEINLGKLQEDISILNEFATYEQLTGWLADRAFSLVGEREPTDQNPKGLVPVLMSWIHANYPHELSLRQFASDNHVSLGYLSRLFKSQTGLTFSEYVIRHRIAKAKELLDEGDARLSDVCGLVGYEDAKHFSELFKKFVGERPHAYAKRKKENSPPSF